MHTYGVENIANLGSYVNFVLVDHVTRPNISCIFSSDGDREASDGAVATRGDLNRPFRHCLIMILLDFELSNPKQNSKRGRGLSLVGVYSRGTSYVHISLSICENSRYQLMRSAGKLNSLKGNRYVDIECSEIQETSQLRIYGESSIPTSRISQNAPAVYIHLRFLCPYLAPAFPFSSLDNKEPSIKKGFPTASYRFSGSLCLPGVFGLRRHS